MTTLATPPTIEANAGIIRIGRPPVAPPVVPTSSALPRAAVRFLTETAGAVVAVVALIAAVTTVPAWLI